MRLLPEFGLIESLPDVMTASLYEWGRHVGGIMLLTASEGKLGAIASHMDRASNS
jgi:hypothetical protein